MPPGRLSPLQVRVLAELAGLSPPWTLSGGAALAGFHTAHRETRDLDLFWQARSDLGDLVRHVRRRLEASGLEVSVLDHSEAFGRLRVRSGEEMILVDLIADPVALSEQPVAVPLGDRTILVDTPHQILVNKLCALLSRSELRDLLDVQVLLRSGGDLLRALADCPRQDGGFSPLTFAWTVRGLPIRNLAERLGWSADLIDSLEAFREELVNRVVAASRPRRLD